MKKTKKGWDKSGLSFDQYMPEPCEIDEAMYLFIGELFGTYYCQHGLIQGGDPEKCEPNFEGDYDIMFYMTVSMVNDKYFYLGVLPEFKQ